MDEYSEIIAAIRARLELMRSSGIESVAALRTNLEGLKKEVSSCAGCRLSGGGRSRVLGFGKEGSGVVFVLGAPLEKENDETLFNGEAGAQLQKILRWMARDIGAGFRDENDFYICRAVKCPAPGEGEGLMECVLACRGLLEKQLKALKAPRVVVALGPEASLSLLGSADVAALRGRFYRSGGVKFLSTFGPGQLIENPGLKKAVRDDLELVIKEMKTGKN